MLLPSVLVLLFCGAFGSVFYAEYPAILDNTQCTWGPTYWCRDLRSARHCGAVKHCIQTVWEHKKFAADNDSVCTICKDMVTQARQQLESNETQEELKEVFEGSCKLIPLRAISKECCVLADEFIPELVDTLASQMNPLVVCSVAGLCNNARIDNMLAQSEEQQKKQQTNVEVISADGVPQSDDCSNCQLVVSTMEEKFRNQSRDDVLANMLVMCGKLGSFSDACSSLILTYFSDIYNQLNQNLKPNGLCHLAGQCTLQYHFHSKTTGIQVIPHSAVGVVKQEGDDLPCDLCEQLVIHLRDILVANTTESEFEEMLLGICKQTGTFKDECLSIVKEYYPSIYSVLVNDLDASYVCKTVGLCSSFIENQIPIARLLPVKVATSVKKELGMSRPGKVDNHNGLLPLIDLKPATVVGNRQTSFHRVHLAHEGVVVQTRLAPESAQLPPERYLPQSVIYALNKEACVFCEYFLHYVQQTVTTPAVEKEIKDVVDKACDYLPSSVNEQCKSFVETYGDAFVALLAQDIDPSQVCPRLGMCPSTVMVGLTEVTKDKPACPLCLLAVSEVLEKLKENKTRESIQEALENLCGDLPDTLAKDCRNFVELYAEELEDILLSDFTAQEACVYLKLCDEHASTAHEITSNDIPPLPISRLMPKTVVDEEIRKVLSSKVVSRDSSTCVICEFIMDKVDTLLKKGSTEAEIKHLIHNVCNMLPNTVMEQCNEFVNQYADLVIELLAQELDPKEVCTAIHLCTDQMLLSAKELVKGCAVCEAALAHLYNVTVPSPAGNAEPKLKQLCKNIPVEYRKQCQKMITVHGHKIASAVARSDGSSSACVEAGLCTLSEQKVKLLGAHKCTWGPGYWCQSKAHAAACGDGAVDHCKKTVWKTDDPIN